MYVNGKLVIAVWPAHTKRTGDGKKHLCFNAQRAEGFFCGFAVPEWWQNPHMTMRGFENVHPNDMEHMCKHCRRALMKMTGEWKCRDCGGEPHEGYSTVDSPSCYDCWYGAMMGAEAEQEARAGW